MPCDLQLSLLVYCFISQTGYELHGVENLPEGPGIVVYYHGAIPIDYLYFLSRLFLWKKRLCLSVADHFVFRLPGKSMFSCIGILNSLKLLLILVKSTFISIGRLLRGYQKQDEGYQIAAKETSFSTDKWQSSISNWRVKYFCYKCIVNLKKKNTTNQKTHKQ